MNKDLASWFTINLPGFTAAEMGVTTVYDETTGVERDAGPDEFVWACFQGMPIGWTWALWVCHKTFTDVMEVAARPRDTVSLDRHVAASMHGNRAVHAPLCRQRHGPRPYPRHRQRQVEAHHRRARQARLPLA